MLVLGILHNDSIFVYIVKCTTINLVNLHYPTYLKYFYMMMYLLRFTLLATFKNTMLLLTNYHTVCYIPMTSLSYKWKMSKSKVCAF